MDQAAILSFEILTNSSFTKQPRIDNILQQVMQCTYNLTLRRVLSTVVAVEEQ